MSEILSLQPNDSIRTELIAIASANNGYLAPEMIVDAARPPAHPLHDYFTWDDAEAGERFRIAQAAYLIRRVKLHIVRVDSPTQIMTMTTTRAIESDPAHRGTPGSYRRVELLMADPESRTRLIAQALTDLRNLRRKYERLEELAGVWAAIDAAQGAEG